MKKGFAVFCAVLLASAMTVTAFAEIAPLAESPEVVEVVVTDAAGGNAAVTVDETAFSAAFLSRREEYPQEVQENLEYVCAVMEYVDSIDALLPDCEGMELVDVMNVSFCDEIVDITEEGGAVAVTVDMKVEFPENAALKLAWFFAGEWIVTEEANLEVLEEGAVVVHLSQPGAYALLVCLA